MTLPQYLEDGIAELARRHNRKRNKMGAAKDMWMAEVEQAQDAFWCKEITEDEFRSRLKSLGFDAQEITEQVDAIFED